ncbi:hypothetical protein E4T56_gene3167 [Termitomyces sp. T112]|nr:hypothetical protein E4T56_gene3167 [Termitomyces sp. T112]
MFLQCFGVDEDVIKVYAHYALGDEVPEDVVHHSLEGGRAIGESEEHYEWLKQPPVGLEGSLPLISFLDAHIVVTPPDVQFSEVLCTLEVVDKLGDEEERVMVLHYHCIEYPHPYLHVFEDVFSKASFDSLLECKSCKVYPLAPWKQDKLDAFLQENLDSSHICLSKSPMASPVFFIKKKNGSLQLVQDYWVLNAMMVKNHYPLSLISKLINNLQSAQYFTKLDVWWSYNNMCIQEGDEWKAAFQTNQGLFEPVVMFFGFTNSPAIFQTMMNNIFLDLIAEGIVCVYLDDILIYTKILEKHCWITCLILEHICQH